MLKEVVEFFGAEIESNCEPINRGSGHQAPSEHQVPQPLSTSLINPSPQTHTTFLF